MMNWAIEIRRYREQNGLRQQEFAERLGITQATVSRWESGRQKPDVASQEILKPLLLQALLTSELVVLQAVHHSPTTTAVGDGRGRIMAASASFGTLFGVRPPLGVRAPYRMNGDGLRERQKALRAVREQGFFDGRIALASVTVPIRTSTAFLCEEVWHPIQLGSGEIVARADMVISPLTGSDADRVEDDALQVVRVSDMIAGKPELHPIPI